VIAVVPSLLILILYVRQRLSWRRAVAEVRRALAKTPPDTVLDEYLARRALLYVDYARLLTISADPWVADAELARLGVRRPE
jgi:hypothetical protein